MMEISQHIQTMTVCVKPQRAVGIVGYGAYVPRYRLPAAEVARVWAGGKAGACRSRKRPWRGSTRT